jgi:hypothetical protein
MFSGAQYAFVTFIKPQNRNVDAGNTRRTGGRARDLGQEDGRTEPRDADFKKAREELSSFTEDSAPEVPPGDENLTSWNESADTAGQRVDTSPPDQDVDVGLELVEEGLDEADQDQRRAAKDDDQPAVD